MAPHQHRIDFAIAVHLQAAWDKAHAEGLDPDRAIENERRIFRYICECDPTPDGRYLVWLSAWRQGLWIDGAGFRTEMKTSDISRTYGVLRGIQAFGHLMPDLREIDDYSDWKDLWPALGWGMHETIDVADYEDIIALSDRLDALKADRLVNIIEVVDRAKQERKVYTRTGSEWTVSSRS